MKRMHIIHTFNEMKNLAVQQLAHFLSCSCLLTSAPASQDWGCGPRAWMLMWIRCVLRPWAVQAWQALRENNIFSLFSSHPDRSINPNQPGPAGGADRRFSLHHCQSQQLWWMKSSTAVIKWTVNSLVLSPIWRSGPVAVWNAGKGGINLPILSLQLKAKSKLLPLLRPITTTRNRSVRLDVRQGGVVGGWWGGAGSDGWIPI